MQKCTIVALPEIFQIFVISPSGESASHHSLRAAVVDQGQAGGGHYVNLTKNRDHDSWIHSSDTT